MKVNEGKLNAKGKKFAIVVARFNDFISTRLLDGALDCLKRHHCDENDIEVTWVPGSFEIPLTAKLLAQKGDFDAIICLGAVIRGETPHFDYVSAEVSKGIANVGLQTEKPVIFGIITADTVEQAIDRAGTKAGNKGWAAALTAIEMADLVSNIK